MVKSKTAWHLPIEQHCIILVQDGIVMTYPDSGSFEGINYAEPAIYWDVVEHGPTAEYLIAPRVQVPLVTVFDALHHLTSLQFLVTKGTSVMLDGAHCDTAITTLLPEASAEVLTRLVDLHRRPKRVYEAIRIAAKSEISKRLLELEEIRQAPVS